MRFTLTVSVTGKPITVYGENPRDIAGILRDVANDIEKAFPWSELALKDSHAGEVRGDGWMEYLTARWEYDP